MMASTQGTCVHFRDSTPSGGLVTPCRPMLVTRIIGSLIRGWVFYDGEADPTTASTTSQSSANPQFKDGVAHDATGAAVGSYHLASECTFS